MELDSCEICVLNTIFYHQPSKSDAVASVIDYASMFGQSFDRKKIEQAIVSLHSEDLIVDVSSEVESAIGAKLRGVHGPLLSISRFPHYSLTSSGGNLRWDLYPQSRLPSSGYTVQSIEHAQFFSPSEDTIRKLAEDFQGSVAAVFGVYLATNNECVDGYVADLLLDSSAIAHPVQAQYKHTELLQQVLSSATHAALVREDQCLTDHDLIVLMRLSGFCGASAFASLTEYETASLQNAGLVLVLIRSDSLEIQQKMIANGAIMFGMRPRSGQRGLSPEGCAVVFRLLHSLPDVKEHLLAYRVVGEYKHHYFVSLRQAVEHQHALRQSGMLVTNIERIGRWCYYWWDVHDQGVRFSSWKIEPD